MKSKNDLLKIIGVLSMAIDHVGYIFFPDNEIFRIIGRLAFPIFAFHIYLGIINTKKFKVYILRLLGFAVISQLPYMLAFQILSLNSLFTLLLSALLIKFFQRKKWFLFFVIIIFSSVVAIDAGLYGVLIPLIFYLTKERPRLTILIWILWTLLFINYSYPSYQLYGIVAIILCLFNTGINLRIRLSKWFFYIFYPAHLLILVTLYVFLYSS
ncbi:TraX family protein [Peribacillus loiseleuriae]|uniref:TraX family protein n=1 Tax=Peribacillus loiseleuriae TaxID=1679170 RepID=UPI003D08C1C4